MMRSMFSGVSGLKVHQTRMDVIGNNIANVNTVGYKSQRVTFSDVFSQTIQGASGANDETGRGGVNPMQVGLGVNVSSIDSLMTNGSMQRTDNPFDLMISGSGFIVVGDAEGTYFTRAGALRQDDMGNLIIPNGMKVKGWPGIRDTTTGLYEIRRQEVEDINLAAPDVQNSMPTPTSNIQINGNLCSTEGVDPVPTQIEFYDSLGESYKINLEFTRDQTKPNTWTVKLPAEMTDSKGNKIAMTATPATQAITFDTNGSMTSPTTGTAPNITNEFTIDLGNMEAITGSKFNPLKIDMTGLKQYGNKTDVDPKRMDGNTSGKSPAFSIGNDGIIIATYDNGDKRPIGQVVVAEFDNPAGLEKVGDNLFINTANSGDFDGIGKAGNFQSGVLEMSNVDLSAQFTDMIITQRGFQANSRIISVSDEMLQELTNLKR